MNYIMINTEELKLIPDSRTEKEIELDRARICGAHEAIKIILHKIMKVENTMQACGYEISEEFTRLRNELGVMVYKNWPHD